METPRRKLTQETVFQAIWLVLGLACLTGAIFFGATHHFFTAGICAAMALAFHAEKPENRNRK